MNTELLQLEILSSALSKKSNFFKLMECDPIIFGDIPGIIFEAYRMLYEEQVETIDFATLTAKLHATNTFHLVGETYLMNLMRLNPAYTIDPLITQLEKEFYKFKIKMLAKDIYNSIEKKTGAEEELVNKFVENWEAYITPKHKDSINIEEMAQMDLDDIFIESNFVRTGFRTLDDHIVGFFNGQLIVVGGRQKKGKTSFLMNLMKNLGGPCLFFSLEMQREEVYSKFLAMESNVEAWKIETKKYSADELARVKEAHEHFKKGALKLEFYYGNTSIDTIKNTIIKAVKRDKPRAIFIDYMQLIAGGRGENQNLRIAFISRTLKLLAHSLNVPIIVASQLSRESEKQNRQPISSDLRDSGSLEQDADLILFVHESAGDTQIIVGDARKAKKGVIEGLTFKGEYSLFEDSAGTYQVRYDWDKLATTEEVKKNPDYFQD